MYFEWGMYAEERQKTLAGSSAGHGNLGARRSHAGTGHGHGLRRSQSLQISRTRGLWDPTPPWKPDSVPLVPAAPAPGTAFHCYGSRARERRALLPGPSAQARAVADGAPCTRCKRPGHYATQCPFAHCPNCGKWQELFPCGPTGPDALSRCRSCPAWPAQAKILELLATTGSVSRSELLDALPQYPPDVLQQALKQVLDGGNFVEAAGRVACA